MELISPLEKPSRTFHAVCAYWLTSSDGSNAWAEGHHASSMTATPARSAAALRLRPSRLLIASYLIGAAKTGMLRAGYAQNVLIIYDNLVVCEDFHLFLLATSRWFSAEHLVFLFVVRGSLEVFLALVS